MSVNFVPESRITGADGLSVIPHDLSLATPHGEWSATARYPITTRPVSSVLRSSFESDSFDIAAAITAFLSEAYVQNGWRVSFAPDGNLQRAVEVPINVDEDAGFRTWARRFHDLTAHAARSEPLHQVVILITTAAEGNDLRGLSETVRNSRRDAVVIAIEASAHIRAYFDAGIYDSRCMETLLRAAASAAGRLVTLDDETPIHACISASRPRPERRTAAVSAIFDVGKMVATVARRHPDRVALRYGKTSTTYRGLYRACSAMAHVIRQGARPSGHVVFSGEPGPGLVGLILAAVFGRVTFTVLAPDEPVRRSTEILRQLGGAPLIVTVGSPSSCLMDAAAECGSDVVEVASDLHTWPAAEGRDVDLSFLLGSHLGESLYTAFTSGSTGKPKGIPMSPNAFGQFIDEFVRFFHFGPDSRIALWAAPFYDAHYCEIFGALCSGGTLCVPQRSDRAGVDATISWLDRAAVTHLEAVPSVVLSLLRALPDRDGRGYGAASANPLHQLQAILCAGEPLPPRLVRLVREKLGDGTRLYNLYGPSECVLATWTPVDVTDPGVPRVPIGQPIGGRDVAVVDRYGRLKPTGLVGEIEIVSPHLIPRYVGDPGGPESPLRGMGDGIIAFRTGDLGRLRADGELEHLGRLGSMVKRHGVRIELKDIEAALAAIPAVEECAVVGVNSATADDMDTVGSRVVAYVTGRLVDEQLVRAQLVNLLPIQLLPDEIRMVVEIPRLPNGKIDNRQLRALSEDARTRAPEDSEPLTPIERIITATYQEVLGRRSPVGRHDNFFAIGGHSLAAAEAIDRINRATATELTVRDLFRRPVVAELAASIAGSAPSIVGSEASEEDHNDASAEVSSDTSAAAVGGLSTAQSGFFVSQWLTPLSSRHNVSIAFELHGPVDIDALARSAQSVVDRHPVFRHRFRLTSAGPRQYVDESAAVTIRTLTVSEARPSSVAGEVIAETAKPFDLANGPLARFLIVRLEPARCVFLLVTHHIVCDEASLHVIARTVSESYNALVSGQSLPAPSRTSRYLEFAAGSDLATDRERLERFWRAKFHGLPGGPDRASRPGVDLHHCEVSSAVIRFPAPEVHRIRTTAASASASLSMMITAIVAVCLGHCLQREWVIVEVPVSVRGEDWRDVVGCFATAAPLPIHLPEPHQFRHFLRDVRDLSLDCFENAAAGYDLLKRAAGELSTPAETLGDAVVAVHEQPDPVLDLTGARCTPYPYRAPVLRSPVATYWRSDGSGGLACTIEAHSGHRGLDPTRFGIGLRSIANRALDLDVPLKNLKTLVPSSTESS